MKCIYDRSMISLYYLQLLLYIVSLRIFRILLYIFTYISIFSPVNDNLLNNYDYIIVGSGTAGSLIAHRISKETTFSYIVLEVGQKNNFIIDIPVIGPLIQGSEYDWQFTTTKQNNVCLAMNDQKCKLPQGKLTGGSAMLNNMIHIRGNLTQYSEWFNNRYDLSYFENQFEYIEKHILRVEDVQYESVLADKVLQAAAELGYKNIDVNKKFSTGFMKSKVNQKNGKRWSTSHNFDGMLNILNNALVTKILVSNKRAYGVQFEISGQRREIYSNKGVIISAGTFNTPKILLISGIGPKDTLKKLDIPLIKDLPVGHNLQDHVTTGLDLIIFNNSLGMNAFDILNPLNIFQYFANNKGPLTSPGCEVVGFVNTKNKSYQNPDLQFMVLPVGIASDLGTHLRYAVGIKDDVWDSYFSKTYRKYTASILPILLHPKSRGIVTLKDKNPHSSPLIIPNYLQYKDDIQIIIEGLNIIQKIITTEPMKKIGAQLNPNHFPGCENFKIFTEEYWDCYIRHLTLTSFHPIGTCKMGLPTSRDSVVDNNFNVIDITNLFVADGSVLPSLPSGNINAAIAMMANIFFDTEIAQNKHKSKILVSRDVCYLQDYIFFVPRQLQTDKIKDILYFSL